MSIDWNAAVCPHRRWTRAMGAPLRCCLILAGMAHAGVALGEETVSEAESPSMIIEEVIVTGIRKSQEQALAIKRDSTGFVDAVTAEDVGKLPDQNVAEAIQRIPGAAIQRDNGEGNFVSIRGLGPEFVRATVNGRTIASTAGGREFNFDVLASETINRLALIKTPSAQLEEGGIGGTIDLQTARPLDMGEMFAGSVRANHNEFSGKWNPRASGIASWADENGGIGALLSASYSDNTTRSDRSTSFGYSNNATFGGGFGSGYDTDGDGIRDVTGDPYFPFSANLEHDVQDRERTSVVGALQLRPDDTLDIVIDGLFSSFDIGRDLQQALILTAPILVPGNPDRSQTLGELVLSSSDSNTVSSATHAGFNLTSVGIESLNETETILLGANLTKELAPWILSVDLAYSKAEAELTSRQAVLEATQLGPDFGTDAFYTATVTTSNGVIGLPNNPNLSTAELYTTRNIDSRFNQTDDEEYSARLDVVRVIDGSLLESVQVGVGQSNRHKGLTPSDFNNSPGRLAVTAGIVERASVDDFLRDDPVGFAGLLFPVVDPWYSHVLGEFGLSESLRVNQLSTYSVDEKTSSTYAQVNIDGEVGGLTISGNLGVRVFRTRQTSSGFSVPFQLVINEDGIGNIVLGDAAAPIAIENDYNDVLPSLNLTVELDEGLILRLAASEVVTRPTLSNLGPSISINATQNTASAGNPGLQPFASKQCDLGLEWYFGEASALHGAVFYKDIGNFVAIVSGPETISGVDFIDVSRPRNAESAEVVGVEIGYQQAFANGFGFIANLTRTSSTAELDPSVSTTVFALEGLSKYTYNLIGYYDEGPIQARLAYNYRDEFLRQAVGTFNNSFFTKAYSQLDASISYDLTETFTIFAEGVNLTDSIEDEFAFVPERPFARAITGRRYATGVRATF